MGGNAAAAERKLSGELGRSLGARRSGGGGDAAHAKTLHCTDDAAGAAGGDGGHMRRPRRAYVAAASEGYGSGVGDLLEGKRYKGRRLGVVGSWLMGQVLVIVCGAGNVDGLGVLGRGFVRKVNKDSFSVYNDRWVKI